MKVAGEKALPAWPRSAAGQEPGVGKDAGWAGEGWPSERCRGHAGARPGRGADHPSSPPGSRWGTRLLNETEVGVGVFEA